ncbi:hypothetical protein STXM2123_4337 [Streptomyces sp. F-3]|nr:hypothetical protein STXM2123_4337 [Streptomyces sp. F-3]
MPPRRVRWMDALRCAPRHTENRTGPAAGTAGCGHHRVCRARKGPGRRPDRTGRRRFRTGRSCVSAYA